MRSGAYVLLGIFLALLNSTLYRFLAPFAGMTIGGQTLAAWTHGTTPDLVLPLVVYLGLAEVSMARGALLSFSLGWAVDLFGGGPAYLFRFAMVTVWWISRAASSRISVQTLASRVPIAFAASVIQSFTVLIVLAIFGADSQRPVELSRQVLPRAVATAIFAPWIFSLAHRLYHETRRVTVTPAAGGGA